jgi:hypothetical protein
MLERVGFSHTCTHTRFMFVLNYNNNEHALANPSLHFDLLRTQDALFLRCLPGKDISRSNTGQKHVLQ